MAVDSVLHAALGYVDGCRWIGLDRKMPKQDAAAILGEILSEADALIRLRLKEQGLELPLLVVGASRTIRSWCEAMASPRSCARSVRI